MSMHKDCRHYHRRTVKNGEKVESCSLDVAPDAPLSCPSRCLYFEKRKLDTSGFTFGSLGPQQDDEPSFDDADSQAVLEALRETLADVEDEVLSDERERRKAASREKKRSKRRRRK